MPRLAYVNGRYVPHGQAGVHVEDRGYQFADGVYEVITIIDGCPVDQAPHLDRLDRSLGELQIEWPVSRAVLDILVRELIRRNGVRNGIIYLQITRGVAPRDHKFPAVAKPSLVMTTKEVGRSKFKSNEAGVKVITIPDIRWHRRDIKSISLLPNCLGKQAAFEAGAYEALQVAADGFITEGTSTNAWIVSDANELITRAPTHEILEGITRRAILKIAEEREYQFVERPFSVEEAKSAAEAFVTSATSFVTPIVRIDSTVIGDGSPGPLTRAILDGYWAYAEAG